MWLFKGLGLALIFSVCSGAGFLKSRTLTLRAEALRDVAQSLYDLSQRIRLCSGELSELLPLCFKSIKINITESGFSATQGDLTSQDTDILNEFLRDVGMSDSSGEYNRAISYAALFESRYNRAKLDSDNLCKLYKSLGVLCGIFICIFFL